MERTQTLKEIRAILREAYKVTKQLDNKEQEVRENINVKIYNKLEFKFPTMLSEMAFQEFFEGNFPDSSLTIFTNDKGYKSLGYLKDNKFYYNPKKKIYHNDELDEELKIKYKNDEEFVEAFIAILSINTVSSSFKDNCDNEKGEQKEIKEIKNKEIHDKYGYEEDLLDYVSHIILTRYLDILKNEK